MQNPEDGEPVKTKTPNKHRRLASAERGGSPAAQTPRERRFRVIHGWYPSPREIGRIGALGLIVDVTPQQQVNDVPSVERRLGPDRPQ